MALTAKMVASEVLMCGLKFGLKQIPIIGQPAAEVIDNLQKKHEALKNTTRVAELEAQISRVERGMRDQVEREIRTILGNLGRPAVPGPELTREMTELRQIYDQGWMPNLFEGILRNSTHWQELRRNPKQYGRILGDHDPVDPENGMHLLIDKDTTRILELPASSLAFLLGNQSVGIPAAEVRATHDIWAFPSSNARSQYAVSLESPHLALPSPKPGSSSRVLFRGFVLCGWTDPKSYAESGGYSRFELTVTGSGIKGTYPNGAVIEISIEDLYYAHITYNGETPTWSAPPEFNNGIQVGLEKVKYYFQLKYQDWELLSNAIESLRGELLDLPHDS